MLLIVKLMGKRQIVQFKKLGPLYYFSNNSLLPLIYNFIPS